MNFHEIALSIEKYIIMTTTQIHNVAAIVINVINIMCTDRDWPKG